jgi:hypothetical protein
MRYSASWAGGDVVLRVGTVCIVLLFAALETAVEPALAQSPVERGGYLVNSIMACGNCHTVPPLQ